MKRSVVFCIIIFVSILLVICFEAVYNNILYNKVDKIIVECLESDDINLIRDKTQKIYEILDKTRMINNKLIPTGILEDISMTVGDMQQYIKINELGDYKVSANQLRQHLTHLYSTGLTRNLKRLKGK